MIKFSHGDFMIYRFILLFLNMPTLAFGSHQNETCLIKLNSKSAMDIIESNIANIHTTRTPEGGPYRRKELICNEKKCEIIEISSFLTKYEPSHPDADEVGYVLYPDIDLMSQIKSMLQATRYFDETAEICR
jgi:flagellar basal body rod protein FlgC